MFHLLCIYKESQYRVYMEIEYTENDAYFIDEYTTIEEGEEENEGSFIELMKSELLGFSV